MKKRFRSAVFIVVYRKNPRTKTPEYLLLKRKLHWIGWEFPKGGIEKGESKEKTAKRECQEESGLKPLKIKRYNLRGKYLYKHTYKDRPGYIGQTYSLFSAEVGEGKTKIDKKEHSGFKWTNFKTAIKKLTWDNQKKCLGIVNRSLIK